MQRLSPRKRGRAKEMSTETSGKMLPARLPALLYHRVGPLADRSDASLSALPEKFERQVRWLARRGYRGICPSDWHAWRQGEGSLPEKPVVLTFDDGYADLAVHALPVLARHGFGAAVFIVTSQIEGTNLWDQGAGRAAHRLMSAAEIRAWSARGIEFGSHTRTHRSLKGLPESELESEIAGSRRDLEAILDRPVRCFAYPYGDYDRAAVEWARREFDLAFSIEEGLNTRATDPWLMLRSQVIPDETRFDLFWRVHFGWSPLHHLRRKVGLRTRLRKAMRLVLVRGS